VTLGSIRDDGTGATESTPPKVKPLQLAGCYWWLFKSADDSGEFHFSSREAALNAWNSIGGSERTYYVWQLVGVKGPKADVPPAFDERVYQHLSGGG